MKSEILYRSLSTIEECVQAQDIQLDVWGDNELHVMPWMLFLDLIRNGGLVLGAFDGDKMVGFNVGFLGTDHGSPNRPAMARLKFNSHAMGVHPEYQDAGIGYRLKVLQRDHAIANGVRLVTWTYDPLQSRNANLNLRRLGVVCNHYIREYYGEMRDVINLGFPSDRFHVEWWVTSDRVERRLESIPDPLSVSEAIDAGAKYANTTDLSAEGLLLPIDIELKLDGSDLLVEIPPDLDSLRAQNQELSLEWRLHTRRIFERVFANNYYVTDFIFQKGEVTPRSFYVLSTSAEIG
jgi:predicted GNAT superfamily acetyltransferase